MGVMSDPNLTLTEEEIKIENIVNNNTPVTKKESR